MAEELYQKLTGGESVHLLDWPHPGATNELLLADMHRARTYITEGLALRAQAGIKVRQPLESVTVPELPELYQAIIAEELNVKQVLWGDALALDTNITAELKQEGQVREVIRLVQNARKQAGLQVDDRISLVLETGSDELSEAIETHRELIKHETLATHLTKDGSGEHVADVKVDGLGLQIKLQLVSL